MTLRKLFGIAGESAAPSRTIPFWWVMLSLVLAWGLSRTIHVHRDHAILSTAAFVVMMALLVAPGWLVVSRFRRR